MSSAVEMRAAKGSSSGEEVGASKSGAEGGRGGGAGESCVGEEDEEPDKSSLRLLRTKSEGPEGM